MAQTELFVPFGPNTQKGQTERLKSELFDNGTKSENAKIRTFGFQTFTVYKKITPELLPHHPHPNFDAIFSSKLRALLQTLDAGSHLRGSGHDSLHRHGSDHVLRGRAREPHGRGRVLEWTKES